ncbi:MAG: thymidine phosphorylase [Thermodesulfovibrionales bacterium]|nr:thymidine phosphorylase [Thermodesulfovibrionales bacterium]
MRAYDLIKKKRDGAELSKEELSFLITEYLSGKIPDYQMSSFLMAVYFRGMTDAETITLTELMLSSGNRFDFSDISIPKVDKHSTGGVGDKTSIILAPLMAAMNIKVPMIAGRGLGHTGGTIDKLESIPGFRTDLTMQEFKNNIKDIGFSIISQSDEIAPADKKLYSLRDVTATVESIPLIAASIMSKKLAEGIGGLVLDVKAGKGAFMKNISDARNLARTMVNIGNSMGVKTIAVITDMNQPLGKTVGNGLEIKECISALRGKMSDDLKEVVLTLGSWMVYAADCVTEEVAISRLSEHVLIKYKAELMDFIEKGDAFKKFVEFVDAQYGDPEVAFKPNMIPAATRVKEIRIPDKGYIQEMDAEKVGTASMLLGAGRRQAEDRIDHSAGIVLNKKTGDYTTPDEPVAMFHYNDETHINEAEKVFLSGIQAGQIPPDKRPVIIDVVI